MPIEIDWEVIEDVTDLDKPFKKALAKAEDAEESSIRLEWAEAKAEFFSRQASRQALAVAKRDALDKYPLTKDWADEIRGSSPAEIEASAKRISERLEKQAKSADEEKAAAAKIQQDAQQQARQQYGSPAAAGGGTPSRPLLESNDELKDKVWRKLANGEGLQRGQDRMDSIRFQNLRFAEGVEQANTNPSYRRMARQSSDDKKVQDDRTRRAAR